ncbi:beta-ketoacyl synthase N-terminal-like domain-containing protein [Paenibacillus oralis]|uniref:beta-ketoacyl synthase N-terminal-like domain-containing protein n=1 Tax=Paenibacillus oralis TaxID=2490856 RepID=UPI0015AB717C|nr:beta-ketoacyl synthase N-terminal-like domain-containing protein [Paenibacillus oralis]
MHNYKFHPIAIVGYGCIFPPDGYDVKRFWANVLSGKPGIRTTPADRWKWETYYDEDRNAEDKTYCRLGGTIHEYTFPFEQHSFSRPQLDKLNRTQLMLLDSILQAMSMTRSGQSGFSNDDTGVFVGNMLGDEAFSDYSINLRAKEFAYYLERHPAYARLPGDTRDQVRQQFRRLVDEAFTALNEANAENIMYSALGKSVRNLLDIKGPSIIVDSACSAGVLVIDEAIKHLQDKKLKTCITTAVLGNMNITGNVAFAKIGGLSPTHSSPLDHQANGLIPGEGAGTIILKRLDDALAEGDAIYAVIRGVGAASDGKGKSIYAPSSLGQLAAMKKSIERAGLRPKDIDYIETHATATLVGDKVELNTLSMLFADEGLPQGSVALGSVKSQIGHSFSAAGMANLIKVIEGMRHRLMPPTHRFERTPEEIRLEETPFYVNTEAKAWPVRAAGEPRRASVNAFGFGGINASVVVEEYLEPYHRELVNKLSRGEAAPGGFVDIAVVGVGVVDSRGAGKDVWWEKVAEPFASRSDYPETRWNAEVNEIFGGSASGGMEASFVERLNFPSIKFKIPPIVLPEIDKGQQMALMAAGEAIADFGQDKLTPEKTGIYVGAMLGLESSVMADLRIRFVEYIEILKQIPEFAALPEDVKNTLLSDITTQFRSYIPKVGEDTLPGYMDNIIAGRIANFYNVQGPNVVIDSDTTSFMSALEQGMLSLASGENETVIVGGVHANMTPEFLEFFRVIQSVFKDNCPKCLTELGNFVPAEGSVFFVLKKYGDVRPGEKVYARIKGVLGEAEWANRASYGKAEGERAEELPAYSLCCNSFSGGAGRHQFYFGAHGGFLMLKGVLALHHREYSALDDPASEASGRHQTSRLTGVYSHSIMGGDYALLLDEASSDSLLILGASEEGRPEAEGRPPEPRHAYPEEASAVHTFYAGEEDPVRLLDKISRMLNAEQISSDAPEEAVARACRVAVVYRTDEELTRKLKALR